MSAERSKHTGGWFPLPRATTVSTTILAPESRTVVQAAFMGRSSARQPAVDVRKDALIIRKSSVQPMKSRRLCAMHVTTGFAAVCAGCFTTLGMLSNSMNRCSLNPAKVSLSEQELNRINDTITPLLKKGQSLPVICECHRDELPVSERTIYSYIDVGLLDARNIDLRRKLRRPERKKSSPVLRVDWKCHIGRSYEEYKEYMRQNPDAMVSQMDSVVIHSVG